METEERVMSIGPLASYKTRASLVLEGRQYRMKRCSIVLARASQRPTNRFCGIFILIEPLQGDPISPALVSDDPGKPDTQQNLDRVVSLMEEAAAACVPDARLLSVTEDHESYGLQSELNTDYDLAISVCELLHVIGQRRP